MLVMKFKGAVLQNQETLAEVKNRIKEQNCCSIVVVSALKGVMPRLRQLYGLSLRRGTGFENEFNELKQVHEQLAYELLAGRKLDEYKVELQKELDDFFYFIVDKIYFSRLKYYNHRSQNLMTVISFLTKENENRKIYIAQKLQKLYKKFNSKPLNISFSLVYFDDITKIYNILNRRQILVIRTSIAQNRNFRAKKEHSIQYLFIFAPRNGSESVSNGR